MLKTSLTKKTLRPYQIEDLAFYINNPRVLNRSEPATGKTAPSCAMAEYVWRYENGATLFIQPKSIIRKNFYEMLECTSCFDEDDLFIFDPKKIAKLKRRPKVILTTADTLARHWGLIKEIVAAPIKLCLADETHLYFSTASSKRTQFWMGVMKEIPRMVAMTGTPIRGRMDSIYPIIQAIEPRYYGTHERFIAEHAIKDFYTNNIIGWTRHDKLGRILLKHGINRTFKECYGAEKKVIIPVTLDLPPQQRKVYDEFHEKAMLELNDDEVLTASNMGVHTIRCRQLLAHPETMLLSGWKPEANQKDQWVLDEICENYETALLFCTLVAEQERLYKLLTSKGYRVGLINGSVSLNRRAEIDRMFQCGELDYIVASPATAGVGFNWQRADCVVFVSSDYMDDNIVQAYRRAIRGIRETALPIYVLRYDDSVDFRILEIVEKKSALAAKVDPSRDVLTGLSAK